jgi:transcriptional regulator with XRE-family HTH domain
MPEPFADTVGRRIIAARMRRGVGQAELARHIGLSTTALLKIEKGVTKSPRAEVIRKIAEALRVRAEYLLGMTEDMDDELKPAAVA